MAAAGRLGGGALVRGEEHTLPQLRGAGIRHGQAGDNNIHTAKINKGQRKGCFLEFSSEARNIVLVLYSHY